jgi:hypothetical protein
LGSPQDKPSAMVDAEQNFVYKSLMNLQIKFLRTYDKVPKPTTLRGDWDAYLLGRDQLWKKYLA